MKFYTSGANAVVDARDVAWTMAELVAKGVVRERFLVVGPQQTFRELFSVFARSLGKTPPNIKAPKTLTLFFAAFHDSVAAFFCITQLFWVFFWVFN